MRAQHIAETHFTAALGEAAACGIAPDILARSMLVRAIGEFMRHHPPQDVCDERMAAAENAGPQRR